jgi:hypothetical protein
MDSLLQCSENDCINKSRAIEDERKAAISRAQSGAVPAHLVTGAVIAPPPAPVAPAAPKPSQAVAATPSPAPTATATAPVPKAAKPAAADKPEGEEGDEDGAGVWTPEEQTKLEAALAKYPASMDKNERWKAIAAAVGSKNKKQCVARFKVLREQILKAKKG